MTKEVNLQLLFSKSWYFFVCVQNLASTFQGFPTLSSSFYSVLLTCMSTVSQPAVSAVSRVVQSVAGSCSSALEACRIPECCAQVIGAKRVVVLLFHSSGRIQGLTGLINSVD